MSNRSLFFGTAFGLSLGAVFGVAIDNLAVGIGVGVAIGLGLGLFLAGD